MNLTQEVERLEARVRELEGKVEHERRRNDMQAGALRESRAQNEQLILRNEKLAAQVARLNKHMRDALGSAEDIVAKGKDLQPENTVSEAPVTFRGRIATLVRRGGEAA